MHYQEIELSVDADVATIRLQRPDNGNRLTPQIRAELLDVYRNAPKFARVIVLTGAGDVFCAGHDLGENTPVKEIDLEGALREEYMPLLQAIYTCAIPTIAAVNGDAVSTGVNLALAHDVVFASSSANFVQSFAHHGLIPDSGGSYWLPRNIGFARAMGLALFGDPISAKQAAEWGMIWQAIPQKSFEKTVQEQALRLASGPTEGYRFVKKLLRLSLDQKIDVQLESEAHLQGRAGQTRDFKENIVARLNKKAVKFEGR